MRITEKQWGYTPRSSNSNIHDEVTLDVASVKNISNFLFTHEHNFAERLVQGQKI